ncbi:hypothetical protein FACS1894167_12270 [Synergistales bacterium]|nr:hypothetical protein FACS1894167_12270 [Synergistales bacterium]
MRLYEQNTDFPLEYYCDELRDEITKVQTLIFSVYHYIIPIDEHADIVSGDECARRDADHILRMAHSKIEELYRIVYDIRKGFVRAR